MCMFMKFKIRTPRPFCFKTPENALYFCICGVEQAQEGKKKKWVDIASVSFSCQWKDSNLYCYYFFKFDRSTQQCKNPHFKCHEKTPAISQIASSHCSKKPCSLLQSRFHPVVLGSDQFDCQILTDTQRQRHMTTFSRWTK